MRSLKAAVATLEAAQHNSHTELLVLQRSLLAKNDQLLEYEEEISFLKATAKELVNYNTQLSSQVGEAPQEATLA